MNFKIIIFFIHIALLKTAEDSISQFNKDAWLKYKKNQEHNFINGPIEKEEQKRKQNYEDSLSDETKQYLSSLDTTYKTLWQRFSEWLQSFFKKNKINKKSPEEERQNQENEIRAQYDKMFNQNPDIIRLRKQIELFGGTLKHPGDLNDRLSLLQKANERKLQKAIDQLNKKYSQYQSNT